MFSNYFNNKVKHYGVYHLLCVAVFIILSSIGAFFHFLLNHEISIVESWLHNNHWEILIISKIFSLFTLNRWFKMRLYEMKTIKELVREFFKLPDHRVLVISFFVLISYLALGGIKFVSQNLGYLYYHLTSFFGLCIFFGIDFIVMAYLDDLLNDDKKPSLILTGFWYTLFFTVSFRLCVPDYYQFIPYVIFCYSLLLVLSGPSFKNWSNVVCFLVVFIAPMGAFFGMDPVWGSDFSPFSIKSKLALPFLAVIWMVSFSYYKYRDQIISRARRLVR